MTHLRPPSHLPAGVTEEGDGIVTGNGPIRVDAFIDFLCPYCRKFELSAGPTLTRLLDQGQITLIYHPMNFLDEASTTTYSTRAAAASGCAADGGHFLDYARALFANQPPEGGAGLSDAELTRIGLDIGLTDPAFAAGVANGLYRDWPSFVTTRATELGVESTPTVVVAGAAVRAEGGSIDDAVAAAVRRG
jgi:protein-disulfide isomerase